MKALVWWSVVLTLLLVVLGGIQFHWIDHMAESEVERAKTRLNHTARLIASAFDRELTGLFVGFMNNPDPLDAYLKWRDETLAPDIISDVYLISVDGTLQHMDRESGRFSETVWPETLTGLMPRQNHQRMRHRPFMDEIPALMVPRHRAGPPQGVLILVLDKLKLETQLMNALVVSYLNTGDGDDYPWRFSLVDRPVPTRPADAQAPIMGLRRFPEFSRGHDHSDQEWYPSQGVWALELWHPRGPIEQVIAIWHRGMLLHLLGIMAVLAVALTMTLLAAFKARKLAQQQLAFTAGISHELMTPIAAIGSAAQNMTDGLVSDGAQVKEYGAMILNEQKRLYELVDEVLSLARLQTEAVQLQAEWVSARELVEQVVAAYQHAIQQAQATVDLETESGMQIYVDPAKFKHVLSNLLQNALKYGGTVVKIAGSREGNQAVVRVQDNGPGLPQDRRLFQPFWRGPNAIQSQVPGSGLGLHLARQMVEAHGGTIQGENKGGACFTIRLPQPEGA
ncbi:MAG: HAMP domain-containing histidine kinase [Acidobacteria bacterium]|nr:HAMP domain-containing histidine kinase [Acidobacteriota bacterium]